MENQDGATRGASREAVDSEQTWAFCSLVPQCAATAESVRDNLRDSRTDVRYENGISALGFWFSVTGLRLASLLTRRRSLAYAVGTLVVFVLPCLAVSLFIERPLSGLFVWLILPAGIYLVGKFLYGFSDMERKLAETAERGPLGVSQNPGPVPRDNAESWLSKVRKKKIHFMGYPDRPGWEDALQIIRTRIAHAGGEIVESAEEEAEYLIWVDAFVASSCTYEITSVIETYPKVRKVFEPYALLLSRQMPQLDMAIDLAYDLCVFIDKYPVESLRRPPDKLAGT